MEEIEKVHNKELQDKEVQEKELNDEWINNFEKTDKLYEDYYKDDLYYVNLKFIYLNRENEIEKIKQEPFLMTTPNYILREEILGILKKSINEDNRKYTLMSILRYNFLLEPDDIHFFLKNPEEKDFLTIVKNIDTIQFEKTIHMFQDFNDLIFIFFEKSQELKVSDLSRATKKIYLRPLTTRKKTIKKRYKE
jgi:hypothetical protein